MSTVDALLKTLGSDTIDSLARDNSEPGWLKESRHSWLDRSEKLPVEASELFKKYIELDGIDWNQFTFSGPGTVPEELGFFLSESNCIVCCDNDIVKLPPSMENSGIEFLDIRSAIKKYPEICREHLEDEVQDANKLVALNNAFFNSGFFLHVPDDTDAGIIRVVNLLTHDNRLTIGRNIIVLGKTSKTTITEEYYSARSEKQSLINNITSIHVKEGGQMHFGTINALGENVIAIFNKTALLKKDAQFYSASGFFGGMLTLSNINTILQGNGSSSEDYEVMFGNGSQNFGVASNLFHEGIGTRGKVMTKGIFDGRSKGLFRGMINIGKGAKGSSSYLSGHSILLSKDASADAIPGLQIENNDVKATHSASVAQISEEQVFYLMARGFSANDARKLIASGFLEPLIRQIPLKDVALVIKGLFELKWNNKNMADLKDVLDVVAEETYVVHDHNIFEGHYKYR